MSNTFNINEGLNKLPVWIDKRYKICNRKYPETILNIEGIIHHNGNCVCLDTKTCNRMKKKL